MCTPCSGAPSGEIDVCFNAACERRCEISFSYGLDGTSPSPFSVDTTSFSGNGVSPTVSGMVTSADLVHGGTRAWRVTGTTEASEHFIHLRLTPSCGTNSTARPKLNGAQVRLWFKLTGTGYTGGASITLYVGNRSNSGVNLVPTTAIQIPTAAANQWIQMAWNNVNSPALEYLVWRVNIPQSGFAAGVILDDVAIENN
jgi:hypothetical protein